MIPVSEKKIVTSALPYIHGVPHLGNIAGSLLPADIYHRFLDVRGTHNVFICGSDEHGTPLELAALEADTAVEEHADKQHEKVKSVLEDFNMDFSLYSRTHTEYNRKQTHQMFRKLYENGYITEKVQELPYCRQCERFLPDRYIEGECPHCGGLGRGDQCDECTSLLEPDELIDPYCTICEQRDIGFRETKNLFLQLPKFEEQLKEWLKTDAPVPDNVKTEVLNLIDDGLEDRCITRDIAWGFEVPTEGLDLDDDVYDDKVLYVWFDAPIGYIGITREHCADQGDESAWKEYWKQDNAESIYSIGKDNTIFHTVIWPSILLGQQDDYTLPDYEFIHQYLLAEDVQFSKSRGTGLTSRKALNILPADYWRFYLASALPIHHDTTFSWKDFEATINGELNDTVGNYVNRVLSLTEKWFNGQVPEKEVQELDDETHVFLFGSDTSDTPGIMERVERYENQIEDEKNVKKGLEEAVAIARRGDEFLSDREPWNNEARREDVIYACIQSLQALAVTLYPYTPRAAEKLWGMINAPGEIADDNNRLADVRETEKFLNPGHAIGDRSILFEKVDTDELREDFGETTEEDEQEDEEDMTDTISFEQFQDVDLQTGTIVEVEEHPNADKLYVMQVDLGDETKQTCAGLKPHFEPEELMGRQVIAVANLEPSKLRSELSETMVLAVDSEDDVVLLQTAEKVENGLEVR